MSAAGWGGKLRMQTAVILLAAACLSGCGRGSAVVPPSPPTPVTVTVVGPSDTLNTGAPFVFTATAHNATNNAVNWSVVEPGGGSISPEGVYTAPAVPGTYTVKAVSQFDSSASGTAQVVVVVIHEGHIPSYDVGVDYHAYGANFDQTAFLTIYNQPQVRQAVQTQLQGMADRGATSYRQVSGLSNLTEVKAVFRSVTLPDGTDLPVVITIDGNRLFTPDEE